MSTHESAEEFASSESGKAAQDTPKETQSSDQVAGREGVGTKMFDKLTGGKPGDGKVQSESGTAPPDPGAGPTLHGGNPAGG